jgi:putative hemolysin
MSTNDLSQYIRGKLEERKQRGDTTFMTDGFQRWASNDSPGRTGGALKEPSEKHSDSRRLMKDNAHSVSSSEDDHCEGAGKRRKPRGHKAGCKCVVCARHGGSVKENVERVKGAYNILKPMIPQFATEYIDPAVTAYDQAVSYVPAAKQALDVAGMFGNKDATELKKFIESYGYGKPGMPKMPTTKAGLEKLVKQLLSQKANSGSGVGLGHQGHSNDVEDSMDNENGTGSGRKKRAPTARGKMVAKVMREKGLSLGEASKYVKANNLA